MGRERVRRRRAGRLWGAGLLVLLLAAGGCAASLADRGDAAMRAGNPEAAMDLYQKALAKDPGDPALLGKLAAAQSRVAAARTAQGEDRLSHDDPIGAYGRFHLALAADGDYTPAKTGAAKALSRIEAEAGARIDKGRFQPALDLLAAAEKAGVPTTAVAALRQRARAGLARAACDAARAFEAKGLPGNAFLAYRRARDLQGGGCDAAAGVARLRTQLERTVLLGLQVKVTGEGVATLLEPSAQWVAVAGVPLRIQGLPAPAPPPAPPPTGAPPAQAPAATVELRGALSVQTGHQETPTTLTLVRKVGERTEANPEYKTLRRQAGQLLNQYEQLQDRVYSQATYVQALHEAYLRSPTTALFNALQDALAVLDDLQQQLNDMGRQYNLVRAKLGETAELLKKDVTEKAKIPATDVREHARATGRLVITAPWLDVPKTVPLTFEVNAQGYAWAEVKGKGIPAHAAPVPGTGVLVHRARLGAGRLLLRAVQEAIEVRADALVDQGSAARKRGDQEAAIESYVRALLLDPTAPRPAIRGYLTEVRGATLDAVQVGAPVTPPVGPMPAKAPGKATAAEQARPSSG